MSLDPYGELGVPRDATGEQIKAAHRKGVRKHHPDAGGSREKFGALQRSYEILSDPDKRAKYDETGDTEGPSLGQADAMVLEGVSQILSMVIREAMDLETTDVRKVLIDTLEQTTIKLAEARRDATRRLKRIDKLEKKFRRRKGRKVKDGASDESELLFLALRGQRDVVSKELRELERNTGMHERVCGVFRAFDYDFTAPPPMTSYTATRFVDLGGLSFR